MDPDERFQSAHDLALQLRWIAEGGSHPAAPALALRKSREAAAWTLAAVMTLVAIAFGVAYSRHPAPAQTLMRFSAVTSFAGVEAEPTFSPDGRSVAFVSDRGGQFDIWMGLVTGGSPVRITNDPNLKTGPRWSPDGSRIASPGYQFCGFETGLPNLAWEISSVFRASTATGRYSAVQLPPP